MDRINGTAVVADLFGAGKDGFKDGNKALGIIATIVNAEFLNSVQEEMANFIESQGITLDVNNRNQLGLAISRAIKGGDYKDSVRVASTAAINLAAPGANIDGVAMVAGDRFLEKDNATLANRGLYIWNGAAVAATRTLDADTGAELNSGAIIPVSEGTINADTNWQLTTDGVVTIGVTGLTFQILTATGVTPAQFDSTTKLATSAFVQRALGNYQGNMIIGTAVTLTAADCGKSISINLGGSIVMPVGAAVPVGAAFAFYSTIDGISVSRQGADTIQLPSNSVAISLILNKGDTLTLSWNGAQWVGVSGSGMLNGSTAFLASLTANGYQKLPSGVIIQRGSFSAVSGGDVAVPFPIQFPNSVRQIILTSQITTTGIFAGYNTPTLSGFNGNAWVSSSTRANSTIDYIAFGN